MRNAFASEITVIAEQNPNVVLLAGDIGNRLFDQFKARHKERFFNCGVAEANMTSMAAGMALCGLRPVTYSITPFVTTRCLEQIKIDVCYHNLPVIIVGVGSGLSYAGLGPTHHSCDDIAFLRALPNMTVVCPGDPLEARLALRAALKSDGPVYLRLGKKGEPKIHLNEPEFVLGKGIVLQHGDDAIILSSGTTLPLALESAALLSATGITVGVVSLHTVKPLDDALLAELFSGTRLVVTLEEHGLVGGLGGAVAEWLAERSMPFTPLMMIGTPDRFVTCSGNQTAARKEIGLTADRIADRIQAALGG